MHDIIHRKFYDLELTASTCPGTNISAMTGNTNHVDVWIPLISMHLVSDAPTDWKVQITTIVLNVNLRGECL